MRVAGDDWPGFRGLQLQGGGVAHENPTSWSPTRNILWKTLVRGSVAVAAKVYFTNVSGTTTVVAASCAYQALAEAVDEPVSATMAPVDGNLFIRGHEHLYAIAP